MDDTMQQDVAPSSADTPSRGLDRGIDRLEDRRDAKQERRLAGDLRGQRVRGRTEKLLTRVTSGVVYTLIILVCLYVGPVATMGVVAAMAWLCCSEFFHMARMGGRMPNEPLGLTMAIAYPIIAWRGGITALLIATFVLLVASAVWYVVTPRANIADVAVTAFGPVYTSLAFSSIVLIRCVDVGFEGFLLAFGVMGSIWLNDATAYLVGSRVGRHKLAPRISPNKTIEGFWCGLVASVLVWIILAILRVRGISLPFALVCGAAVGLNSVVGDLFESRIKRGVNIKDSGTIMPGHGGLLDRSDSMLFGCMTAYLMLYLGGML